MHGAFGGNYCAPTEMLWNAVQAQHKAQQYTLLSSSICYFYIVWNSRTKHSYLLPNLISPRVLVMVVCSSVFSWLLEFVFTEKACHIISLPAVSEISSWHWNLLTRQTFPQASIGNRVANIWRKVTEENEQRKENERKHHDTVLKNRGDIMDIKCWLSMFTYRGRNTEEKGCGDNRTLLTTLIPRHKRLSKSPLAFACYNHAEWWHKLRSRVRESRRNPRIA
jgi:hypothetical protein